MQRDPCSSTDSTSESQLICRIAAVLCCCNLNFANMRKEPNSSAADSLMWPMDHMSWVSLVIMAQTGKHLLISPLTLYICYVQSVIWFLEAGFPCTDTMRLTSISFIRFTIKSLINAPRAESEEGKSVQSAAGLHKLKTKKLGDM